MSQEKNEESGLIMWLSQQSLPIRLGAFIVFVILIIGIVVALTGGLYFYNISNYPRAIPFATSDNISVAEFVSFDDEEAYPAAVASASDGTLYTGSFVHGAVWRVSPTGQAIEIPQTRDLIGSVIGIDVAADGNVYVLDHLEAFSQGGAKIWQITGDNITLRFDSSAESTVPISKPNDIAVDSNGRVFVLDISLGRILLLDETGLSLWWSVPDESYQIAGLAYNPIDESLLVSDAGRIAIYEIPVAAQEAEAERQTRFILMESLQQAPAFNGLTVDNAGTIYVAAFDLNEIWQIMPDSNEYTVLANNYRGSSDVAYDASNHRLYVNNWDQSWLIPITLVIMQVDVPPRLPFSVDTITFAD